jgi:hypothetical protein
LLCSVHRETKTQSMYILQSVRISFQSSELGPPYAPPARECCSSLLFWVQGGDTLAVGGGGGGTQFRRRDRHYRELYVLYTITPHEPKDMQVSLATIKYKNFLFIVLFFYLIYDSFLSQKIYHSFPRKKGNVLSTGLNLLLGH